MTGMGVFWLAVALGAADAPVTAVTVYSDQARVTRTASVAGGATTVEFPLLLDTVDPSTIRVEANGAEVSRVDIGFVEAEAFPVTDARKLLGEIEKLDDHIAQVQGEQGVYQSVLDLMRQLTPALPPPNPLKPTARLDPSGWAGAFTFVGDWSGRMQTKAAADREQLIDLGHQREVLADKARRIGGAARHSGYRVTASLSGAGPAKVNLTYRVGRARWYPTYDLQLVPEKGRVDISFYGQVSQETGEDWTDSALTLSTAVPATSARFPKLLTWKIGQKDRYVPTPQPMPEYAKPAPVAPPLPAPERDEDFLRQRLLAVAQQTVAADGDFDAAFGGQQASIPGGSLNGVGVVSGVEDSRRAAPKRRPPPPPPMPSRPMPSAAPMAPMAAPPSMAEPEAMDFDGAKEEGVLVSEVSGRRDRATPIAEMSLAPPSGYRAPVYGPDLPVSLAGGYDLSYASLRAETIRSGQGARRVALFTQSWPVNVERKIFPALTQDVFLVAELKNPSPQPLPGGNANLFVGADPSGVAKLKLAAPGESFTLPLGVDRAIKPIRNVKTIDAEKGVISKDDVTEYLVTIEVANPYPVAIQTRILDQWPVTSDKNVEIKLNETRPYAIQDKVKGSLEWRVPIPPNGKTEVSFDYTLRRPKGWRMHP